MEIAIAFIIVVFGGFGLFIFWDRHFEKVIWNGGVCCESGKHWRCYKIEGDLRYYNDGGENTMLVKYGVDKHH